MFTKIFSIFLFLIILSLDCWGQKLILSIDDISYDQSRFQYAATFIKQSFEKNFLKHKGVTIVDRDQTQSVLKERELQKNESFIDGVTVKQDKALGAQYMIKLLYVSKNNELTLKLIDVETGALILFKNYPLNDFVNSSNYRIGREDFFDRYIKEQVQHLIYELDMHPEINLVRLEKKNNKEMALLYCPDGCNLKSGDELKVYFLQDSEYKLKETVGTIKVKEVEGAKSCLAEIKDGKNDILQYLHKNLKCYVQN